MVEDLETGGSYCKIIIHDLEKGLDAKQALELEIERLKGAFQVMNHIRGTDLKEKKKLEEIKMELQEKEEELEELMSCKTNNELEEYELQDSRKKLKSVCIFLSI